MGHAFHQLYYHFAWATHAREPHIHSSIRAEVLRIVREEANNRGGWPIRHNAMFDIDNQERHHASGRLSELLERTEGDEESSALEIAP